MVDNNKNERTHAPRETRRLVYEKNGREELTRERRRETKVELHIVGKEQEEMLRVGGRGNLETLLDGISEIDRLLPTVVSCDRWQLVSIVGSHQREFANEKSDRNYFRKTLSGRRLP